MSIRTLIAALLLTVTLPATGLTPLPPDDVAIDRNARRFYAWVLEHPGVGVPEHDQRVTLKTMLTTDLSTLLERAQEVSADAAAWAAPDEKPRMIEGDLFVDSVEGAHEVSLGAPVIEGDVATLSATLVYIDTRFAKASRERVVAWTDTLELRRVGPNWLIADVRYRGEPARTLTANLRAFVEGE